MNRDFFIKQLDEIIQEFNDIKLKAKNSDLSGNTSTEEIVTVLTKSKAAVQRIAGLNSEYYKEIEAILLRNTISAGVKLKHVIGSVIALKGDLENDYLKNFEDIIKSEVFSDYLEMAEHLLEKEFQDPAAVLIGSTLEAYLRELCVKNNIDIETINTKGTLLPKKADLMNSDLAKKSIYSSAYQKQITAWLSLRNSAAHGKYEEYSKEEVNLMMKGVRHFILSTT
jgi:hypothetical protein